MKKQILGAFAGVCLMLAGPASAVDAKADALSAKDKNQIIEKLSIELNKNYVFPEVAASLSKQLTEKNAKHGYDQATTKGAFAEALTKDMRTFGNDLHFGVFVAPDFKEPESDDAPPTQKDNDALRARISTWGYGVARVERLTGNVGYLDLRGFGTTEFVAQAYASAMSLLSGTDAMIIDLRRNGGGSPSSVAYLMSYFFVEGDERHLNDLYYRPKNETRSYWTNPVAGARYTKPVYVLTSGRTFSAAEECAYNFQTQKRATLIGETTGGGANPGGGFALGHDLVTFISTGRAINPITHTNWEHVGVKPDIAVPAEQAFYSAYTTILQSQLAKATEADEKEAIQKALSFAEKGEMEPANFKKSF